MKISDLNSGEYLAYYQTYLNYLPEQDLIELLSDLKTSFLDFLSGLKEADLQHQYAPQKWTVAEVLQHMLDTERIFQYRSLCIARKDLKSLPGFDQDAYVPNSLANRRDLNSFILEFTAVRDSGIALYKTLNDEMLTELGEASGAKLSPRAAGFITAGHQVHHQNLFKTLYNL
ncbi:DinB family protein [Gillisia sp. M10.2A]|uniref:DinB family protein n=1 Tax=Gillisia lutea TaxID=2909668 RepID=A0ABS9EFU6_9FLAO|nr:DinB family protein [Gillisia lutea]MCF4101711.1 DinB family protein [Gillisia lutea]